MISLHLIPETPAEGPPWSCAEIRMLRPYQHPSLANRITVSTGRSLPTGRIDAVVLQRFGAPGLSLETMAAMVAEIRRREAKIIYDLDDDLLAEHPSPSIEISLQRFRPNARFLLREADAVIVSTSTLRERLRRHSINVAVWQNALDEALVPPLTNRRTTTDFGYFGTVSHLQDLMGILGLFATAAGRRGQRPSLELCGISEDTRLVGLLPHRVAVRVRPIEGNYPRFHSMLAEANWSVGLAPLIRGEFNDTKSDIKLLDYAAAGIPTIASDVPAYENFCSDEIVMRASIDDFGEAAFHLLFDEERRRRISAAAYQYLLENRVLNKRAPDLLEIVEKVLDSSPVGGSA